MDYKFDPFYKKWSLINSYINLAGFILAWLSDLIFYWIGGVILSFIIFAIRLPMFLPRYPLWIGYANWITLFRLVIILFSISYWDKLSDLVLFGFFGVVIILDGVDGYIARKFNQISKQGEYLDMEIDAVFVFLLSYMHFSHEKLNAWILIPGGLRYLYGILLAWIKEPPIVKPGKRFRSTVAVMFFISLLLPFVTNKLIYIPIVLITSSMIILSFSISAIHLLASQISSDR